MARTATRLIPGASWSAKRWRAPSAGAEERAPRPATSTKTATSAGIAGPRETVAAKDARCQVPDTIRSSTGVSGPT